MACLNMKCYIVMKMCTTMDIGSIPNGVDNFRKLISGGGYYIDKTRLIEQVLSRNMTEVFLFTRPRRFGKSLNLSMLDAYLNQKYEYNDWFDGLYISETDRFDSDKNANVVIYLNLKDLGKTYDSFVIKIRERITEMYGEFSELEDSKALKNFERSNYAKYLYEEQPVELLQSSLKNLSRYLHAHHGKPVIILIDEYDDAINRAIDEVERRNIIDFMREFLSPALKGNTSLRMAVLTGVMHIGKEMILSGLNNIEVNNVFSEDCDELFGFTEKEVQKLCSDFNRPDKFNEIKDWYDGYRFGNADIYNPWSVLKYLIYRFKADTYWGGTSDNSIIPALLRRIDWNTTKRMMLLLKGGAFITNLSPSITYSDDMTFNASRFFSALTMSGYITAICIGKPELKKYAISIPNKEMMLVFREEVFNAIKGMEENRYMKFVDAAASSDTDTMRRILIDTLVSVGERLLPNPDENVTERDGRFRDANYNILVLAMVGVASNLYRITADMETGDGRADIFMHSTIPGRDNIIMELKWKSDMDADLESVADAAIEQIHTKKYYLGLKGGTRLYGIAFRRRSVCIHTETYSE